MGIKDKVMKEECKATGSKEVRKGWVVHEVLEHNLKIIEEAKERKNKEYQELKTMFGLMPKGTEDDQSWKVEEKKMTQEIAASRKRVKEAERDVAGYDDFLRL